MELEGIEGFAVMGSLSNQALAWVLRRDRRAFRRTRYLHALGGLLGASGSASLRIVRFFATGGYVR